MYIVTGGLGFIGSALIKELNSRGIVDILIVDRFRDKDKWLNVRNLTYSGVLTPEEFLDEENMGLWQILNGIFHMGACSSTTECDMDFLWNNNTQFSKSIFSLCAEFDIPLCYASSAATYGDGQLGYDDDHNKIEKLSPLNKYGYSKHLFDLWALDEDLTPPKWYGLKFFNVYGPNEYHKEGMRSVVVQAYEQINSSGEVKLFKSYVNNYAHGEQKRDFIYVKDVTRAMADLLLTTHKAKNGIYNMGTGEERSFNDLARAVFKAMKKEEKITFIDMPENLRERYQYSTKANMKKFKKAFSQFDFTSLEEGVKDYIENHLSKKSPYLGN